MSMLVPLISLRRKSDSNYLFDLPHEVLELIFMFCSLQDVTRVDSVRRLLFLSCDFMRCHTLDFSACLLIVRAKQKR